MIRKKKFMFDETMVRGLMAAALRMAGSILILLDLVATPVPAQTFTVLGSFNGSNGRSPLAV